MKPLFFPILASSIFLVSCSDPFDRPEDIHNKLIPIIASDILNTGDSPLLREQSQNFLSILEPTNTVRWDQKPIPGLSAEGTITFYRMPDDKPLLSIGFNLHMDKKSYIFEEAK